MHSSDSVRLTFPTSEFRVLPIPLVDPHKRAKIATCFVRAADIPSQLQDWMAVNPRVPKINKKEELHGTVAKAMVQTLMEEPERFALKNQGIYLLVKEVTFDKREGGRGEVSITLDNPDSHGLVNGGHTFRAIRQVAEDADCPQPWDAYVRLHIMEGIDEDLITDLAEGLNRSMQVDNPSLENLRGRFDNIKKHLVGLPGADQIAYHQGDMGDVDVLLVLTFMAMFDLETFPDRKTHPNKLFGQPKAVLDHFVQDSRDKKHVFDRIVPKLHEILVLSDRIQQESVLKFARLKVTNAKKGNRVGSEKHKGRPAYFAEGKIDGNFALGWLYPMLAAFRANISPSAWVEGRLEWLMDPEELLKAVIDEMAEIVIQEHKDNNRMPAEVGKKESAYRGCYGVVTMELAQRGLLS